ncbi:MAG: FISUMP domain-containing protein [Patescibacteria group bacterium]|jgi:uncharacterized protein (TIGR02145 family)/prepilin-type N-terminal cleavage/methylation domain-containing protein
MEMFKSNKSAFTLVELLVVIAIIGILATLAIVSLQNARSRARDAKRIADVRQIQTALELYFNDNGAYPVSTSVTSSIRSGDRVYMEIFPQAPNPPDGNCDEGTNQYIYTEAGEDNGSYTISFCVGFQTGSLNAGDKCATPIGILNTDCFACGDVLSYEGYDYTTVEIGDQCWFGKNLNLASKDGSSITRYCLYSSCDTYGAMYKWDVAMDGSTTEMAQGLCPDGWHIPSDDEWQELIDYASPEAGTKLRATFSWRYDWNGSDIYGFRGVSSGYFNGAFNAASWLGMWWTSTENVDNTTRAWYREFYYNSSGTGRLNFSKTSYAIPVRCIMN